MTPKSKIKAIDGLTKSQGWRVMREVMEQEILQAAMQIAETPSMPLDEINFRRGSIWAAKTMLEEIISANPPYKVYLIGFTDELTSQFERWKKNLNQKIK